VDRQLLPGAGPDPTFGPVKDRRNKARTVPVDQKVIDAISEHLATYGQGPGGVLFTGAWGGRLGTTSWSGIWRPVAQPLGIPAGDGFHLLRHFYASSLIRTGCSVKEVQARLGNRSGTITLDVYGHLWPSDEDRTRMATAAVFKELEELEGRTRTHGGRTAGPAESEVPGQEG
jgi:integrase